MSRPWASRRPASPETTLWVLSSSDSSDMILSQQITKHRTSQTLLLLPQRHPRPHPPPPPPPTTTKSNQNKSDQNVELIKIFGVHGASTRLPQKQKRKLKEWQQQSLVGILHVVRERVMFGGGSVIFIPRRRESCRPTIALSEV